MADDEQFSLCWNNFNTNLSAGFHESLCRGDLVDVTLAAEGQLVKAHRLVLSVCSPYFRKMFTQMPANQHAFVFLKDVSHSALKDLIQFMYCGEVNVKQEALPAFISTAEALQIKGLTDSDPPSAQSPPEPSTPTQQIASPRLSQQRQRTTTSRSYKIETVEDSIDDKPQSTPIVIQTTAAPSAATIVHHQTQHLQSQQQHHQQIQAVSNAPPAVATTSTATLVQTTSNKRSAQRSSAGSSGPHVKRTKSTIDPLDTTETAATTPINTQIHQQQQITVQTAVVATDTSKIQQTRQQQQASSDTEYIDLPTIELPTKSEPEYTEDTGEVVSGEQDTAYVEDDTYADMRYDDSYFTENEDGAAPAVSAANTSGVVSASTSKAVIKQTSQSFSDSSYVDPAEQGNSEAQVPEKESSASLPQSETCSVVDDIPICEDLIPLHTGSQVFVSKKDLSKAYIPNACIYASRLTDLVFGKDTLKQVADTNVKERVLLLPKDKLQSIIIEVNIEPKLEPSDTPSPTPTHHSHFKEHDESVRKPFTLPRILDGKFYNNIQPNQKTSGGIQATCTTCFGTISGTTKSTGNFLSHIKRRHKDILPYCQVYCQSKNSNSNLTPSKLSISAALDVNVHSNALANSNSTTTTYASMAPIAVSTTMPTNVNTPLTFMTPTPSLDPTQTRHLAEISGINSAGFYV